jgi:hypothetical protein
MLEGGVYKRLLLNDFIVHERLNMFTESTYRSFTIYNSQKFEWLNNVQVDSDNNYGTDLSFIELMKPLRNDKSFSNYDYRVIE